MKMNLEMDLYQMAATTFEEFAFMFVAPEYEDSAIYSIKEPKFVAKVEFSGPHSGKLIIKTCDSILESLAENMLGDENVSDKQRRDALGEIANVVCGNVLPKVYGVEAVFNIAGPEVVDIEDFPTEFPDTVITESKIVLDQGPVYMMLIINND